MNKELIAVRDTNKSDQSQYLEGRKSEFKAVMRLARDVFGNNAFRKYNTNTGAWSKNVDVPVLWSSLFRALVLGRQAGLWNDVNLIQNAGNFQDAIAGMEGSLLHFGTYWKQDMSLRLVLRFESLRKNPTYKGLPQDAHSP